MSRVPTVRLHVTLEMPRHRILLHRLARFWQLLRGRITDSRSELEVLLTAPCDRIRRIVRRCQRAGIRVEPTEPCC